MQKGVCGFFYQAEGGIGYRLRSRGLGDVCKRRAQSGVIDPGGGGAGRHRREAVGFLDAQLVPAPPPGSYTPLTPPTSGLRLISVGAASLKKKTIYTTSSRMHCERTIYTSLRASRRLGDQTH